MCTLLLLLIPLVYAQNSPAEGNFDCASYDARQSQDNGRGCLHRLKTDPDDYEQCRDSSNTTCYIFLQEPPFITLNRQELWNATDDALPLQRPFPCGDYASVFKEVGGIGGIAMGLHEKTSSKDDLCMWGGNSADCKFNQLVDYTEVMAEQDYRFAVTGLLLELPQRQCSHEASAPFVDNSMIIIGLKTTDSSASQGALSQLTRPFHWGAWAIFGGVVLIFMVVCFAIAVRFHVFRGRSLITAFFIFAGERDQALAHEASLSGDMDASHAVSFATKYGLAMTLYRIALLSFVGIFVLFYEVAVVNFLFQQQSLSLARSVTTLTEAELTTYAVLKNSALENVWNATGTLMIAILYCIYDSCVGCGGLLTNMFFFCFAFFLYVFWQVQ